MTQYYVTAEEVLQYLKIDYDENDISFLNNTIIPMVCDEIDELSGSAWRKKEVKDEWHEMGAGNYFGVMRISRPIYLQHYPVKKITSLKVYSGYNKFDEWIGVKEEGIDADYWVDYKLGIVYINTFLIWYKKYAVSVSYIYGDYNEVDETPNPLPQVKRLSLLLSAKMFMDSERYLSRVAEGIGDNTYASQMERMDEEIEYLRSWLTGLRVISGGLI